MRHRAQRKDITGQNVTRQALGSTVSRLHSGGHADQPMGASLLGHPSAEGIVT